MMTSAQVVETSVNVTSNSPSQEYTHPDDRNLLTFEISVRNLNFWRLPLLQDRYLTFFLSFEVGVISLIDNLCIVKMNLLVLGPGMVCHIGAFGGPKAPMWQRTKGLVSFESLRNMARKHANQKEH